MSRQWGFRAGGLKRLAAAMGLAAVVAGCTAGGLNPGNLVPTTGPVPGEVLGTGAVKVALILPLSATGGAGQLARDMRNAADLALREFKTAGIQILVKDDKGTPEGARAATSAAIAEGATLILGPLFAQSVTAAGAVAKASNVPVVAFSTDSAAASRGVYLIGFLPQGDVERIIRYAAAQGKRSIAALIPSSPYGTVVQASLQSVAASAGVRVVALETYTLDRVSMQEKATAIANIVNQGTVNAVYIPDGGEAAPFLAQVLAAAGVHPSQVKFLGSGQWNDPRTIRESNLNGGWFPSPDAAGFQAFAQRYKAAFGTDPVRNASLAYDAVSLAAGLSARFGATAFTDKVLTTPSGFIGIDGAFRFLSNGLDQRALAVFQIERNTAAVIDPAPKSFR